MDAVHTDWREEIDYLKKRCGFYLDLYERGIKIPEDKIKLLHKYRYLKDGVPYKYDLSATRRASNAVGLAVLEQLREKENPLQEIKTEDWMPKEEEVGNYPADFVAWIDSINQGFKNRIGYNRFDLYCKQAEGWLAEKKHFSDFEDNDQRFKWTLQEWKRIQDNSLYYLQKYVSFKTGSTSNKYNAFDAQKIVAFLVDSGYCLLIGKGRQIFFSTTIGAIAVKRINFHKNYFVKMIAENLLKTEEIFEDKIKFCFYNLPNWMKSSVASDQEGMMRLMFKGYGGEKGNISGANSKLMLEAPYITAINGGSPDLVLLDEIGQMPLISDIIQEGRPTLFATDPITGKMKKVRQVVAFGTGGSMEKGGAELQDIYDVCVKWWQERNFTYGFIPIFFDFWARPGITQKHYDDEKAIAYASGKEEEKARFHQHYPETIQDMFLSSAETVIPIGTINSALQRIYARKELNIKGHFEPIYDKTRLQGENAFVPFAVTGAIFVPSTLNEEAPVTMYEYPELNWINRYFQGTDPINSQSGYSYLSSSIWDSLKGTVPCLLDNRTNDYRVEYFQSYLMNIYFGRPPHLIEQNSGRELINNIETWGGMKSLLAQTMLPDFLQVNSTDPIGIKKVASNSPFIYGFLMQMLESYKDNIWMDKFFHQLKTFVKKDPSKTAVKTDVSFKVSNYKYYRDDAVHSILYAYICSQCFLHRLPRKTDEVKKKRKVMRLICDPKQGYQTTLQETWV